MKLRKTRIKKETKANGKVVYTAQYKAWVFWYEFNRYDGLDTPFISYMQYIKKTKEDLDGSERQAKAIIDFYISYEKHTQASKIENKIVKTEYEDYP